MTTPVHPISASHLLDHANRLLKKDGDPEGPKHADLRRVVSSAYYAVFHRLTLHVAHSVLPDTDDASRYAFCRLLAHGEFTTAFKRLLQKPASVPENLRELASLARTSDHVVNAARLFVRLQWERHDADYDHKSMFNRSRALDAVDMATHAIDDLDRVPYDDPAWQAFVGLLLRKAK